MKRNDIDRISDLVETVKSTFEQEIERGDEQIRRINILRNTWYHTNIVSSLENIKGIVDFYDNVSLLGIQPPKIVEDFKVMLSDANNTLEEFGNVKEKVSAIEQLFDDLDVIKQCLDDRDAIIAADLFQKMCNRNMKEFEKHDLLKCFPETVKLLASGSTDQGGMM